MQAALEAAAYRPQPEDSPSEKQAFEGIRYVRGWLAKRGIIAAIFGLLLVAAVGAWLYVDFSGDVATGVLEVSGTLTLPCRRIP